MMLRHMVTVDEAHANVARACKQKRTSHLRMEPRTFLGTKPLCVHGHYTLVSIVWMQEVEVQRKIYAPRKDHLF